MKRVFITFSLLSVFLIGCNGQSSKKTEDNNEEYKKEIKQLDSTTVVIEKAQKEIDSATMELDNLLNEIQ